VAPSHFISPAGIIEAAVLRDPMPVLFIENKLLYPLPIQAGADDGLHVELLDAEAMYPCVCVRNYRQTAAPADVTLATYGGVSRPLQAALEQLVAEEIRVEAFLPVELRAGLQPQIVQSYRQTRRLVLVEESTAHFGWSAEVVRGLAESLHGDMPVRVRTLAAAESVIPCDRSMEDAMLPTADKITATILESLRA
jgi:acetoin:2,6-dichlorophenolindophenol oxidoreductase subunit beta